MLQRIQQNPNKTYTVLVSLDSVTTEEFTQLFTGCSGFTQVYDCITEGVDDPMYGGYLDCEGKTAAQLAAECYADTYDSICSELDSYDQQAAEIRESYMYDETVEPFVTQPPVDTFGKDIDTSDIKVPGSSYSNDDTDFQLAEDLADLQEFHDNFVMLKQAMEQGRYRIYGVKLTLTGAQAQALLQSNKVRLVEKLTIFLKAASLRWIPPRRIGIKNMTFHTFAAIYCLLSFAHNCTLSIVPQSVCV